MYDSTADVKVLLNANVFGMILVSVLCEVLTIEEPIVICLFRPSVGATYIES